jgi:ABC-2 type transport system permease protein
MKKYWSIFKISFQQEFVYKINFLMWRIRNIIQIFVTFFLWSTIFSDPQRVVFGYDREKIITYVFGVMIVKAFVLSSKAADVAGDVARGDLSNYLIKPLNYFKYWFTRDISAKTLNLFFASIEFFVFYLILKPEFFFQSDPLQLLAFLASLTLGLLIYFCLVFMVSSVPFWAPELGWGSHFLVTVVIVDFLSGSLFPIDVLPLTLQKILLLTPFPYLLYVPVQVYLGKNSGGSLLVGIAISLVWLAILWNAMKFVWNKGLRVYQAFGR